jgi:hypothetical protein
MGIHRSGARQEGADFDTIVQVGKTLFRNAKSKIHPLSRVVIKTAMGKVGEQEGIMKISLNCGDLDERLGNVGIREGSFRTAVKQVEAINAVFDARVTTWDADKERMLAALRAAQHRAEIDKVKARMRHVDNGSYFAVLASGSIDDTLRLWYVATGDELHVLTEHANSVGGLAFSPDGQTLASGSQDNTVRLWNVATGEQRATLKGHADWVSSVAFFADGTILASASHDRTIRLWRAATEEEVLRHRTAGR